LKNIVLIGFMGTGKTVIGRRLANRLNREFIDTDVAIEAVTGKTIAQIFAKDGVIRFRSEEALLAKKIAGKQDLVISTGGGMVLNPQNVSNLKINGVLVALTAPPEVIYRRVKNKKTRPLLLKGDLKENILSLLKERERSYKVADITIDTGAHSVDEVVEQICRYLSEGNII